MGAITEDARACRARTNAGLMAEKEKTVTYRWGEGDLIQRIDIRHQANGRAVAYVYADNRPELLGRRSDIRSAIRLMGWGTLSDHRDGQYVLRVSGLKDGADLLKMLQSADYVKGEPHVSEQADKGAKSENAVDFVKNNSLRASGIIYMLGNAMYYISGLVGKDKDQQRMALAFTAGDGLLGAFGGRDDARQFRSLLTKLKHHMEGSGIEIPQNAAIYVETSNKDRGFGERAGDFMHDNINALKISAEVLGGFFATRSGLQKDAGGKRNWLKAIGGAVVVGGWGAALAVKEKKPDDEALKNASPTDKAVAYIQEKPLRLAGWAGLAFNALNFGGTWNNRHTSAGKWNMGAVGAMVSANSLYSISNKTTGGDIKTEAMIRDVYSVAAQILNKQPDEVREAAIESTAKFLGERPEIRDTHEQIVVRLREEMDVQRQNPWFEQVGLAPYRPDLKARVSADAPQQTQAASPAPAATVQAAQLQHQGVAATDAALQLGS